MKFEGSFSAFQGRRSDYHQDIFTPIPETVQREANDSAYQGEVGNEDVNGVEMACCVPTIRVRAPTISSSDGGHAKNVGRDCVWHRSVRYATEELNAKSGFLASLVPTVCQFLGVTFPEVNRDSKIMFHSISREEAQFVKALTRGRGLLEFTIGILGGQIVIPGNVARRLYHTHGFPADFTRLMSEKNGITISMMADDKVNARAQHL